MSLVDTRYPELDLFLQGWRNRLNRRFLAGEALAATTVASLVAALVAAFSGPGLVLKLTVWAGLTGVATAGFTLWQRRRRLSRAEAAAWLDEFAGAQGLFRAASECLDRDLTPLGTSLLAEADRQQSSWGSRRPPRVPWRRLALRFAAALASTALCLGSLVFVVPPLGYGPLALEAPSTKPSDTGPAEAPDQKATRQLTSQEAAKRLFPEDQRLAALAEQALASGDPGALEALLQQNSEATGRGRPSPSEPGGRTGQGNGGSAQPNSSPGTGKQKPGDQQPKEPGAGDDSQSGAENSGPQDGKGSQDPGQAQKGAVAPSDGGDDATSEGRAEKGPQGMTGEGTDTPYSSGGKPGIGHSQQALGSSEKGLSERQLALKDKTNPGVFEYVLPGAEAKLPPAQVLADSRRSAEAVISRTSPPQEFENTIRDYFLSLSTLANSQEVSP